MESWTDNKMGDEKVSIAPAAKKQGFESGNSRNQLATSGHWEARVGSRMSCQMNSLTFLDRPD